MMVGRFIRISAGNIIISIQIVNLIRNRNGGAAAIPIAVAEKRRISKLPFECKFENSLQRRIAGNRIIGNLL